MVLQRQVNKELILESYGIIWKDEGIILEYAIE